MPCRYVVGMAVAALYLPQCYASPAVDDFGVVVEFSVLLHGWLVYRFFLPIPASDCFCIHTWHSVAVELAEQHTMAVRIFYKSFYRSFT
jgi:hypothetical protein